MQKFAKIFMNGGSQAVRLPAEYRFEVDEVLIEKIGEKVVLSPRRSGWDDFFDRPSSLPADFLDERADAPPQKRPAF